MKNITKYAVIAASAAFALVSCNKEIDNPVQNDNPSEGGIKVTVVAGTPETKTFITGIDATHAEIAWQNEDKFGFVNVAVPEDNLAEIHSIDGSGAATIEGNVATAGTFFAYYPKSTYDPTSDGAVLRIRTAQTPPDGTTFDPAADVLVSTTFDVAPAGSATTPATIQFKRLGAFLKVSFQDNTTGSKLSGEFVKKVSVQSSAVSLAAKLTFNSTGIVSAAGAEKTITATYDDLMYIISNSGEAAYLGVQPVTLPAGSNLIVTVETDKYVLSKTVSLPSAITLASGDIKPIKVRLGDSEIVEHKVAVERVWGKYSTAESYWNEYFSGTGGSDRNIAMDDNYIYLPETKGTPLMWKIPLDGVSAPTEACVTGVYSNAEVSAVTHALSCVRMVPNSSSTVNGGKDFLMACSLNTNESGSYVYVYSYANGTDNAPTVSKFSTWCGRRLGDKFSVWGSLQNGALFMKDWNNVSSQGAVVVLRMAWDAAPTGAEYFNPRRTNMISEEGIGGYYPYPDDASKGVYARVDGDGYYVSFGSSPLSTSPNETGTFTSAGGYYGSTAGYNFVEFNGRKYIGYVKNAGGGDGRFYILSGAAEDSWEDILGSKRNVIYQADIQQDLAYYDGSYHEDLATGVTKTSSHGAIDCTSRIIGDDLYFAALKQGVGLSLFKVSLK